MAIQKKTTQDEKKQSQARKTASKTVQATAASRKATEEKKKVTAKTSSSAAEKTDAKAGKKTKASAEATNKKALASSKAKSTKAASAASQPKSLSAASSQPAASEKEERADIVYQPEFEKSVLDQPGQHSGPVYRYSDAELQEFKELILKKLEAARQELAYLQGLITRKDEMGTEDTENKYMSMEDGSGTLEREQLNQMASRQIQFIDHLEKALVRIENKTYGICRVTGKLIDKARLRAVPHATLSIEAKKALSKGS
ncbi:MAG: TraR/DksA family transcriptional regulator [Thermoflavifilum sp.]|nr:TraR/DksA family transcriptional regulator [Thermoflavifilum sp.]